MYLGRIVEIGDTAEIFANPKHPYTKALLAAIPDPDPSGRCPRTCSRVRSPMRPSRRQGARSTRAAPRPSTSAAGSRATWWRPSRATGCSTASPRSTSSGARSPTSTSWARRRVTPTLKAAGTGRPDSSHDMLDEVRGGEPGGPLLDRRGRHRRATAASVDRALPRGRGPAATPLGERPGRLPPLPTGG